MLYFLTYFLENQAIKIIINDILKKKVLVYKTLKMFKNVSKT